MIRVLVVDDSAIVRDLLSRGLAKDPDIEVIGTAPDPFIARNKILSEKPDVVTLDIEMPRMDGLTFLKVLMNYHPLPVIIVSSVSTQDKGAALEALSSGAFDVVNKPDGNMSVEGVIDDIIQRIKSAWENRGSFRSRQLAAQALTDRNPGIRPPEARKEDPVTTSRSPQSLAQVRTTDSVIALGASTGGTIALEYVLPALPANLSPVVLVQHMPRNFTAQFAQRLDGLSKCRVCEARDGDILQRGTVYIAPGGMHMEVERKGSSVYARLADGPKVQYQKPSVDMLFWSVARTFGKNALGVLLTGMGRDGAQGLQEMKNQGATAIIQDEESSVVWGMPRAAWEIGAWTHMLPLDRIPESIAQFDRERRGL